MKHYQKHIHSHAHRFRRCKTPLPLVQTQRGILSRHQLGELVAQMID